MEHLRNTIGEEGGRGVGGKRGGGRGERGGRGEEQEGKSASGCERWRKEGKGEVEVGGGIRGGGKRKGRDVEGRDVKGRERKGWREKRREGSWR